MAAVIGQRLPKLTKKTLTKFRTDESLDHFYADVACKSEGLLSEPTLPRKRRTLVRLEVGAGAPSYPQAAKDHFRGVYYEGIHLIVGLYITALIRKASAPTPRWRPSWLKLILVTTRQSSVSWCVIQRRCWYRGATWATKYFGSYVKGGEDIMF